MQNFVASLYFTVDTIVFMIEEILFQLLQNCLLILPQASSKCPKSSEELSCLGALSYCFHYQAEIRLVCSLISKLSTFYLESWWLQSLGTSAFRRLYKLYFSLNFVPIISKPVFTLKKMHQFKKYRITFWLHF